MSGDPLKSVQSGAPFVPSAAMFNALIDAAKKVRESGENFSAGRRYELPASGQVMVRNNSGATRQRYQILSVRDVVISPSDALDAFQDRVHLDCGEPTDTYFGKFVVLEDTLLDDEIGRAYVDGICVCKIHGTGTHVDIESGVYARLKARPYGHARILYSEAGSGERWAVIRLNDPQLQCIVTLDAAIAKGASGTCSVMTGAPGSETDTGINITCSNRYASLEATAKANAAWVDGRWHLTAGECGVTTTSTSTTSTSTSTSTTTSTTTTPAPTTTTSTSTTSTSTSTSTTTSTTSTTTSTTSTSTSTTTSTTTTAEPTTTTTTTTESCEGSCSYSWACAGFLWVFLGNTCTAGCTGTVCCPPSWCGAFEGQIFPMNCMSGQTCGGPPTGCSC